VTTKAGLRGGGREYKAALKRAMDDAHKGEFSVLVVWALDRIVRDEKAAPRPRCGSSASSASAATRS
jgi:DNA invertase Pin-like site-specific DNA recombinase